MEAPFTRVGPGQSLRLVDQVMGQNGPIANPTNIRYIPAGTSEAARAVGAGLPPLSALTAYAQLANVGLGLVNVGLSAAVLVEARKQTKMLRELQADVKQIRADLDVLIETTQRIDVTYAGTSTRGTQARVSFRQPRKRSRSGCPCTANR